jgi:tetratricopeptide (TPR) repeat protein
MNETFGKNHVIIIVTVLAFILLPRLAAGLLYLRFAEHPDLTNNEMDTAKAYAAAAARIPWMPLLWEKAGIKALQAGDEQEAVEYLIQAEKQHVISKSGWSSLGEAYQQSGELLLAVQAWEKAIPLPQAYRSLASLELSRGNLDASIDYWKEDIAIEPENASAYYTLGLILTANAPEQALPKLMQAAKLDPDLESSVENLRTALNTALLSDDRAYQFLVSGRALGAVNHWDLAAEAFQKAISFRSDYAEAWAWLGEANQQQKQDGGFEIKQAVKLDAQSAMVQGLYGLYLQRQGKPNEALSAFQKAAQLEPEDPGWQMALGSAAAQTGDLANAYEFYLHAVELAPDDIETWKALVTFSVSNDIFVDTTGLPAAQNLIKLAPKDWESYDLAGQAEFSLGNNDEAESYFKKAIQIDPAQAAPALHLGLVYLQTGNLASCYSYLNLTKILDPNGSYGWQAGRLLGQYFP